MLTYRAPIADARFLLSEVFDYRSLTQLQGWEDIDIDTAMTVIEAAAAFAKGELHPLNRSSDEIGCSIDNGVVRTPPGFIDAYRNYVADGWQSLCCDPEHGGQGFPSVIGGLIAEIVASSSMAFSMFGGLTLGAYRAVRAHGSDALKSTYLPKLATGVWTGTMCMTEPQAGTDLSLIRTRALPQPNGTYRINGTKIFISGGEHDLAENIVHLVLAKLPDAPSGSRGVSLFLVPKFLPNPDGTLGARNEVQCGSIEHKMGLRGSPTCVLNFDDAIGWLLGKPHGGLAAMFTMMNSARLEVAIQALGVAHASYENAAPYAKERLQSRSLAGNSDTSLPADPIIAHPDVRRNLLTMKAFIEGARALAVWVGLEADIAERHPDPDIREASHNFVALMTPIVKAYFSDTGADICALGMQIFGGHGYIRENGMEQLLRDIRIIPLYEGTNGIQAMDLVGRKLSMQGGQLLGRFMNPVTAFLETHADDPDLIELLPPVRDALKELEQSIALVLNKGKDQPVEIGAAATELLRQFGLVAMGFVWLRIAKAAAHGQAQEENREFYSSKLITARFFIHRLLPEARFRAAAVASGSSTVMAMQVEQF
jgi:alkylation response protein AidB-like acyl-CoA dehydrogenase